MSNPKFTLYHSFTQSLLSFQKNLEPFILCFQFPQRCSQEIPWILSKSQEIHSSISCYKIEIARILFSPPSSFLHCFPPEYTWNLPSNKLLLQRYCFPSGFSRLDMFSIYLIGVRYVVDGSLNCSRGFSGSLWKLLPESSTNSNKWQTLGNLSWTLQLLNPCFHQFSQGAGLFMTNKFFVPAESSFHKKVQNPSLNTTYFHVGIRYSQFLWAQF